MFITYTTTTLCACALVEGWLGACQLNVGPWRLGRCRAWGHSLASSIFLLKRHWNKMSSSGRVGVTKDDGVTKDFWEDTGWTKSKLGFAANINKHTAFWRWKGGDSNYKKTRKIPSKHRLTLHRLASPEVDLILLRIKGLRSGSSMLTGEE